MTASLRPWPPPWCCSSCCSTTASMASTAASGMAGTHGRNPRGDRRVRVAEDISYLRDVDAQEGRRGVAEVIDPDPRPAGRLGHQRQSVPASCARQPSTQCTRACADGSYRGVGYVKYTAKTTATKMTTPTMTAQLRRAFAVGTAPHLSGGLSGSRRIESRTLDHAREWTASTSPCFRERRRGTTHPATPVRRQVSVE